MTDYYTRKSRAQAALETQYIALRQSNIDVGEEEEDFLIFEIARVHSVAEKPLKKSLKYIKRKFEAKK